MKAIEFHGLKPKDVFTSEDAKSYKSRKEIFEYALSNASLSPEQVIYIGDSLSSDVKGASSVGIKAVWMNRRERDVPRGVCSVKNLLEVLETDYLK